MHPIDEATENSLFGGLSRDEFYTKHGVLHHETFMLNASHVKIFTQSWRPAITEPLRGLVGLIHGYTAHSSWLLQLTAVAIAKLGFYVCALDLQGHGRSEGPRGHIPDIKPVVDDCVQYFGLVRAQHDPELPAFLYGESLGGAIAMLVCLRQPDGWAGLVLSGAMCGVSSKYKPVWPLEKLLPLAAALFSSWQLVIMKPLADLSYREEWKRRLVRKDPDRVVPGKPTAASAYEFMRVCKEIKKRSRELETPLLVLHGEEDKVCDVGSAQMVYSNARSKDKTMKRFPGMWHQFIGEPEGGVEVAFGIAFSWLKERANHKAVAPSTTCSS